MSDQPNPQPIDCGELASAIAEIKTDTLTVAVAAVFVELIAAIERKRILDRAEIAEVFAKIDAFVVIQKAFDNGNAARTQILVDLVRQGFPDTRTETRRGLT